ncbi:CoB--CoM heterodisulfide reductase subunit B [Candidatus Harpocratesius sp.]
MEEVDKKILHLRRYAESIEDLSELGDLYVEQEKYLEARYYFEKMIEKDPTNILGYLKRGYLALKLENYRDANNNYYEALKLDGKNIEALIGLAKVHLMCNGFEKALFYLTSANRFSPGSPEILFYLGFLHFKRHEIYYAEKFLNEAKEILKQETNEKNKINRINKNDGKDTKTKNDKLYSKSNIWVYISFYLGTIEAQKGLYQNALNEFTLLEDHPIFDPINFTNFQALWNNIALAQFRLGEISYAKIALKKIIDYSESNSKKVNSTTWLNLAILYWTQDQLEEAKKAFDEVRRLEPTLWPWKKELQHYTTHGAEWLKKNLTNMLTEIPEGVNVAMYLGCVIPNRYPFIDAATRSVLNALKVGVVELEGAGCCPAPGVFRSFDIDTWLTLGARNITIAEDIKRNLCIMCNGCYGTLNDVNTELKHNSKKRDFVNNKLKEIGKEFKGTVEAEHLVWVLYHDVGIEKIKKMITRKLGLKVAVHYGCHILKPTHNKPWKDDFEKPTFLDELVELTGCTSVDYRDKLMCCGAGGGLRGSEKEVSLDFTRDKLESMRKAGVDIIVDCCPFCHLQFDLGQMEINSIYKDQISAPFSIPVIYITQLLGLAMGIDPFSLGILRYPKRKGVPPFTPVDPIFTHLERNLNLSILN